MILNEIHYGNKAPKEVNVIIEIPSGSHPVKYELDKKSGALFVDRFIQASMSYPCNYGFIPNTLSQDGDPCDVLVIVDMPLMPGCVIPVRPIGVLLMEDESGFDEKILAVPTVKAHPYYAKVTSHKDLPQILLDKITHFFENYKTLEKDKWVKVQGWEGIDRAEEMILNAIERAKTSQ